MFNSMLAMLPALLLALCAPTLAAPAAEVPALASIPSLDIARYEGRWYEIAKYPNRFQTQCVADTTAEYRRQPDGSLQVINRCRLADGRFEEAVGAARPSDPTSSSKLQVRFAPAWLSFIPWVWGNYWVIDLDSEYRLVAVSEPGRDYLWILARSPAVPPDALKGLLQRLRGMGFDTGKLETTRHASGQ